MAPKLAIMEMGWVDVCEVIRADQAKMVERAKALPLGDPIRELCNRRLQQMQQQDDIEDPAKTRVRGVMHEARQYLLKAGKRRWANSSARTKEALQDRKDFIKKIMVLRDEKAKTAWLHDAGKYDRFNRIRGHSRKARYVSKLNRAERGMLAAWRNAALLTAASRRTPASWTPKQRQCRHCLVPETPAHVLLECPRHEAARLHMVATASKTWSATQVRTWGTLSTRQKEYLTRGAYDVMSLTYKQADSLDAAVAKALLQIDRRRQEEGTAAMRCAHVPPPTFCMEDAIWWLENPADRDLLDGIDSDNEDDGQNEHDEA